jgi:hypothetical protein
LYQVVTVFARLVNEDGVTGLYHWPMSGCVTEEVGRAPELLEYAHGCWPGVVYQREVLTERLLDSRGVPELAGVYQGLLKMFTDSFGDHAQLAGVPPVITRGRRRGRQGKLTLKPLVELPAAREGDYRYMDPPKYPEAVVDVVKEIRRQCDEYFGRTNEEVPADHVTVLRTWKTMWFLWTVREALMQMVALIQQWMPEETIRRIVNEAGLELTEGRADIAGRYDIDIHFDPADLDPANLERVATMIQKVVLPMDREATVMTAPLVESFLYRISPDIARRVVRPVEEAAASEVEDEARRLTEIRAGLEPELPEDGSVNYRLRLAWHRKATELNPERDADLPEDKRRILESRLQRMDSLAQQFGENVRIGREGGRRALE